MKKLFLLTLFPFLFHISSFGQCNPTGDEVSYGNGSWIGYIYDARENFNSSNYVGYITQPETFNTTFGNGNVVTSDCSINNNTFSVRFKMQKTFACGAYNITIGGDDGVRLSIDGGETWVIDEWQPQAYTTFTKSIFLNGTYNLVLEFYEAYGNEQVSFSYTLGGGTSSAGVIEGSQDKCGSFGTIDPDPFLSVSDSGFCTGGTNSYQWEVSSDNVNFFALVGADSTTLDLATFPADTTLYYRRKVSNGTDSAYSNTVSIINNSVPGNPDEYGSNEWIGYVYEGINNFSNANFRGKISSEQRFDESFSGSSSNFTTTGCDVYAETFSVRYRMQTTFDHGVYTFTVGADDGVRLSLDGGATYLIDDWSDHGYRTSSATDTLNGTYQMVLDYYENGGGNRVSFNYTNQMPLPVDLVTFEGERMDDYVELFWITASEINNDYFTVEKAPKDESFSILKKVDGAGTTNVQQIYEANDDAPCQGICYYRLKQTDFDGKTTVYDPIAVVSELGEDNIQDVKLYPNPLKDKRVNIEIPVANNDEIELFINDIYGKKYISDITFIELVDKSIITLVFNDQLPKGVYMISFILNNELITKKLYVE